MSDVIPIKGPMRFRATNLELTRVKLALRNAMHKHLLLAIEGHKPWPEVHSVLIECDAEKVLPGWKVEAGTTDDDMRKNAGGQQVDNEGFAKAMDRRMQSTIATLREAGLEEAVDDIENMLEDVASFDEQSKSETEHGVDHWCAMATAECGGQSVSVTFEIDLRTHEWTWGE